MLLSVNIWLFSDKAQSKAHSTTLSPLLKIVPLSELGISSVDSFHFPLMAPFPSQEKHLQAQLFLSQKTIARKNREINKAQQVTSQLALLKKQYALLQQQLILSDRQLAKREAVVAVQQQKIALLQKVEKAPLALKSEVELVRSSIEHQPDLIKSRSIKKEVVVVGLDGKVLSSNNIAQQALTGSIEFGFLYEQDIQVTQSVKGRLILDYEQIDKYNINSDLDFEFENEDGDMSTNKYRWQLQSDYNIDPINLVYVRSDINRSQFSSYEKEDVFTLGYGRIFFNTSKHKFNIEAGPGYRSATPNVGEDEVSIDEFIIRTRLNYERVISESLQVKMDAVLEIGHNNSVYSTAFKAQNRIYQELYLTFHFEYKFTQNVPIDTENKEVSSGLSLLYAF